MPNFPRVIKGYTLSDGSVVPIDEISDPLAPYRIARIDVSTPAYYGSLKKSGAWYIMRLTEAGDVDTIEYVKGDSGFSTAWTNRASHSYGEFSDVF